ncbi:UNVERIFIED_CONTAM: hypothetical protein PYX00_001802 [Menopon gallinae]|uniref:Peptidoglycan recognition protein family domain-containing protein n=1 Tax=Menopon gallinae TaxID=328185 RepID=A0AAW2IFN4_9NEOP
MESIDVNEIRNVGDIQRDLKITKVDLKEDAGVNLQCVNSTDFMVGKQTNFNGPVTIVNYDEGTGTDHPLRKYLVNEETVIKERVLAPSLATSMENFVKEKAVKEIPQKRIPEKKQLFEESLTKRIWNLRFLKVPIIVWSCLLCLVVTVGVILIIDLVDLDTNPSDAEQIPGPAQNHTVFHRKHWRAAPERSSVAMKFPVPYVIVSSSGGKSCSGLRECRTILQEMQTQEKKLTKSDIYANFLVSSDGSIFEGRGWRKRNAYLGFANSCSIQIECIGDFSVYDQPTAAQVDAIGAIIEYGVQNGKINSEYFLIPANATGVDLPEGTPVIGKNLYEAISDLHNFESDVYRKLFLSGK